MKKYLLYVSFVIVGMLLFSCEKKTVDNDYKVNVIVKIKAYVLDSAISNPILVEGKYDIDLLLEDATISTDENNCFICELTPRKKHSLSCSIDGYDEINIKIFSSETGSDPDTFFISMLEPPKLKLVPEFIDPIKWEIQGYCEGDLSKLNTFSTYFSFKDSIYNRELGNYQMMNFVFSNDENTSSKLRFSVKMDKYPNYYPNYDKIFFDPTDKEDRLLTVKQYSYGYGIENLYSYPMIEHEYKLSPIPVKESRERLFVSSIDYQDIISGGVFQPEDTSFLVESYLSLRVPFSLREKENVRIYFTTDENCKMEVDNVDTDLEAGDHVIDCISNDTYVERYTLKCKNWQTPFIVKNIIIEYDGYVYDK